MFLFISILLHTCSACQSSCLEICFSSWARSSYFYKKENRFSLPDGVVISHRWQSEAAFLLTPPIWLKFQFKLVPAKISLCSEGIPNSSRSPCVAPIPASRTCTIINVENQGECFGVDFFWCSQPLYSSTLTIPGLIKGDFSGQPTGVSSGSDMFNSLFPALRFQCCK